MRWIVFCILSAAFIFLFPFVSPAIQDDAMVLYYSFDAGKGKEVEDLSGKGNHGTLEGDANLIRSSGFISTVSSITPIH